MKVAPARTSAVIFALLAFGCANEVDDDAAMGVVGDVGDASVEQAMSRTCAPGATVKGIDVSKWQSDIDWRAVSQDGVKYAFIRVSDGTGYVDQKFARNWQGAKDNGVLRGAYQFFRSNQDPIAQADLLINMMGTLQPGDLPPVIDVESKDGQSAATIASKVRQWVNRVESATGVRPIVYTGPYFWRDQVNGADFARHPLWIAHYGTTCPFVPPTWTQWAFHQHTSSGRVRGISGNVDMNLFNGTMEQLLALTLGNGPQPPPAAPASCPALPANGGMIDDGDGCFTAGGDPTYLRRVSGRGNGGDLIWTGTTSASTVENFGEWKLGFQEEGTYEIEVYVDRSYGTSQQARYRITHADGSTDAIINQSTATGWVSLGAYRFRTGAGQKVRLNDNTGERGSLGRKIVLDGLRASRLDDSAPAADECPRVQVYGTGSSLNIRPQPNTSRAAVGRLQDGDIVDRLDTVQGEAISNNRTWYKITDGQVTGYITAVYARCTQ